MIHLSESAADIGSFDSLLGPSEQRYFGEGYRSVRYRLESSAPQGVQPPNKPSAMDYRASVYYPERWSLNADGSQRRPHLSSVDAIVMPILALEFEARRSASLSALRHLWVEGLHLRAGPEPWYDLSDVPVEISPIAPAAREVSAVVGNMRTRLRIASMADADSREMASLTNDTTGNTTYGDWFRAIRLASSVQAVRHEASMMTSRHALLVDESILPAECGGLESGFRPASTIVDYLVTMGQLTQALVYGLNRTHRGELGNLWLRTMQITRTAPPTHLPTEFTATTRLVKDTVLEKGGDRVHNVKVECETSNGVHAEATLAYSEQVPAIGASRSANELALEPSARVGTPQFRVVR